MSERGFVTVGSAPRVVRIQALAFHDRSGRIQHMHHAITLEGAEPRSYAAMLEDATSQALQLGIDLARLQVLHITAPFDLSAHHKVDVKKGALVESPPNPPGGRPPRRTAPAPSGTKRAPRRR